MVVDRKLYLRGQNVLMCYSLTESELKTNMLAGPVKGSRFPTRPGPLCLVPFLVASSEPIAIGSCVLRHRPFERFVDQQMVRVDVFFARLRNDFVRQRRRDAVLVPVGGFQPVPDKLFVEGWLVLAGFV